MIRTVGPKIPLVLEPLEEPPPPPPPELPPLDTPNRFDGAFNPAQRGIGHSIARLFSLERSGEDVRFGVDFSRLSRELSPLIHRRDRSAGTFAIDWLATGPAYDVIGMAMEAAILQLTGGDPTWKGSHRFIRDIRDHGFFDLQAEGFEWKDGNFGSTINTIHGVPFTLSSGLLRARGYDPLVAAAGGVLTNLVHEFFFERWEQPKASHDLFMMNMLGAIAGAFPGFGMEIGLSAGTGQPFSAFYGTDRDGHRYSITFEQHRDYMDTPIADRPVLPYDLSFGVDLRADRGLAIGLDLKLVTDPEEASNVLRAIRTVEVSASLRWQLP